MLYIFCYQGRQSMFVMTPEGVIATDLIAYQNPAVAKIYIDEIRKVTQVPIKYVIYSHHHYDHIAGGKPFKDLGATFVAHRNAKAHLEKLQYADAVIPDEVVEDRRIIELGVCTLSSIMSTAIIRTIRWSCRCRRTRSCLR